MKCNGCQEKFDYRSMHRVSVQRPAGTPGVSGHVDLSDDSNWQSMGSRWASFKTRGGSEGVLFDQVQADVSHVIEMPYDSLTRTIGPRWRLTMQGRVFHITNVHDVDEQRRRIRVYAAEEK